jgi:hypothetical protein
MKAVVKTENMGADCGERPGEVQSRSGKWFGF